jgi:histidinol-phosphate aminotransferase
MSRFLSRRHKNLVPYVPGEQPREGSFIKLNTNESPFPPSPLVLERVREEAAALRLYPDPDARRLREKLAAHLGVTPENVLVTNGSDEALAFAFLAFFDEETPVRFPDITYGFYPVYCSLCGVTADIRPLREDFTVCVDDYIAAGRPIILANPNAPTGLFLPVSDIERIAASNPDHIVLIDEAYIDFGGESAVPLINRYENLLVVGTFSKSRSLAGARIGYAVASPPLIQDLDTIRNSFNPYNLSRMSMAAGEAALIEQAYYTNNCLEIVRVREKTAERLKKLGFVLTDSRANFLFARHPKHSGRDLYSALRGRGILVRWFNRPRISEYLRITIGTAEQMNTFLKEVQSIIEREEP